MSFNINTKLAVFKISWHKVVQENHSLKVWFPEEEAVENPAMFFGLNKCNSEI